MEWITGNLGFSYIGLLFMLMLTAPNLIWRNCQPAGYEHGSENKMLLLFERVGQALVTCIALICSDFNLHALSWWSVWLLAAFSLMLLYEGWWIRYFKSEKTLSDFYSSYCGVPVAGATLPVLAFFLLGIYGKFLWMLLAAAILGIGHIGIHLRHLNDIS